MINNYKIIQRIGGGTFGSVYRGINIETNEPVAIKIEQHTDVHLLKTEAKVLNYLKHVDNIPKLKWFGQVNDSYVLVMPLLGHSIEHVMSHVTIKPPEIYKIGIQMLEILRAIHEMKIIHRDIKPSNMVYGLDDSIYGLHLIDFGLSAPISPLGQTHGCIGTPLFMSLNAHAKQTLCCRDDLESMIYVLIYIWMNTNVSWKNEKYGNEIVQLKRNVCNDTRISPVITEMLQYAQELEYNEMPDYDRWILQLMNS